MFSEIKNFDLTRHSRVRGDPYAGDIRASKKVKGDPYAKEKGKWETLCPLQAGVYLPGFETEEGV